MNSFVINSLSAGIECSESDICGDRYRSEIVSSEKIFCLEIFKVFLFQAHFARFYTDNRRA